ncbi:hypothetical protein RHMOL_Rhmol10G0286700 [Rhododendron molle]|uniref:Uncharacterized protein n=4 Tax=Rhododendron molle TaxID=49168 RepID=A0ACC0M8U3_RHOML|nr:hypothetical protein RHMOL_Rhmol10G0286700 [Rhododendron molle]KAI8536826.1 hypothetical protein RHMOL_Rhmol10G0286700 [Rhododendron molle]KAI8536827.1 hypothetical protein RHMOL_Rhmol10G0286700 [Rhododendron molle]KAI8536828.1 hypothetical protein RHMOL_Rhmol10G0286700 [Rhododendron molle]
MNLLGGLDEDEHALVSLLFCHFESLVRSIGEAMRRLIKFCYVQTIPGILQLLSLSPLSLEGRWSAKTLLFYNYFGPLFAHRQSPDSPLLISQKPLTSRSRATMIRTYLWFVILVP